MVEYNYETDYYITHCTERRERRGERRWREEMERGR